MFCWQARRMMADLIEGTLASRRDAAMKRHLASCARCRADRLAITAVAAQVRLASPAATPSSSALDEAFASRVLAQARRRKAAPVGAAMAPSPLVVGFVRGASAPGGRLRPFGTMLPLAAAVSILLLATVIAFIFGGWSNVSTDRSTGPSNVLADLGESATPGREEPGFDTLLPPREALFSVRQDLVGVRNGRIPLTTYVLEPPPQENAVVRASF